MYINEIYTHLLPTNKRNKVAKCGVMCSIMTMTNLIRIVAFIRECCADIIQFSTIVRSKKTWNQLKMCTHFGIDLLDLLNDLNLGGRDYDDDSELTLRQRMRQE